MELHEACKPLAFLLGTWKGSGAGEYPTIESFQYNEEVVFGHVGKPFLSYVQKTRHAESGQPLHAEMGYLRAVGPSESGPGIELVVAQPSGIVEIHQGSLDGHQLRLDQTVVATAPTAKSVTEVARSFEFDVAENTLSYQVSMAAVGEPLTHHLRAVLHRHDPS